MSLIIVDDGFNYGSDAFDFRGFIPSQGCPICICWRSTQSDDTELGPIETYSETFSLVIDFDSPNLPTVGESITINNNTYTFINGTPSTNLEVDISGGQAAITNQLITYWQNDPTIFNFFIVGTLGTDLFLQTQNYGNRFIPTYESNSDAITMYPQVTPTDRQGEDLVLRSDYFVEIEVIVDGDTQNSIKRIVQPIIRYGINTSYHDPGNLSYPHYAEICFDFRTIFEGLVYSSPPNSSDLVAFRDTNRFAHTEILVRELQGDGQSSLSSDDVALNSGFIPLNNVLVLNATCLQDSIEPNNMLDYNSLKGFISAEPIHFLSHTTTDEAYELCPNTLQFIEISGFEGQSPQLVINSSQGTTTIPMPNTGYKYTSDPIRIRWSTPEDDWPLEEDIEIYAEFGTTNNQYSQSIFVRFVDKFACCCLQEFVFLTSKGAYRTLQATCHYQEAYKVEADEYFPCASCLSEDNESRIYRPSYEVAESLRSVPLPNTEITREFIEEFVSASEIWKIDYDDGGNFIRTQVYLTTFPDLYANHRNQIQFEFSYAFSSPFIGIRNL